MSTAPIQTDGVQPRVVYVQQPRQPTKKYDNYNNKVSFVLGLTCVLPGALAVILQIAATSLVASSWEVYGWGNLVAVGIWGGALVSIF